MTTIYDRDLDKNPANYEPLSPLSFLRRTAEVFPHRLAVVHGAWRYDYATLYVRCRRLASALARRGIRRGDTVALIAPNTPAHLEAHFGVPATGAVLNSINTRLDPAAIAFILDHGEAKVLFVDREFAAIAEQALALAKVRPYVIDIDDAAVTAGERIGSIEYEDFLKLGDYEYPWQGPLDEWDAIALGYTSGTTGNPKGVVTHHRGAYLNAMGNAVTWNLPKHPVYLWTLPMFHCDGWCFPWTITMLAGVHVCLRKVEPAAVFSSFADLGVTHFCGAPTVLSMLINAPAEVRAKLKPGVKCMTAGAAPPAAVIAAMEEMGFDITHVYGLTEVYGPAVVCDWHEEWEKLDLPERAKLKARQGVRYHVEEDVAVLDPQTMQRVPADGETMGEIMFRGNIVMKGYLKNPKATQEAFAGGWFHSGDLGVAYPGGYMQIKDRSKDIIISGGENISTLEVEGVLYMHPDVMEAAVVARPDAHWGETPCAFVTLKQGGKATADDIIAFCREHLARFKVPKTVVFSELPKTSTGKIQKFELREKAKNLG
ncbi:acyl-CoA synthetase [Ferrovibrio sp. MS7]|uniref:acyl-CoA synthetase n=1 Tax=Ferrovibrio plantarum TaxID=3119164 RepID=UPI0031367744